MGYQVDLLARAMSSRGHNVTVFCADGVPRSDSYRCVRLPVARNRGLRIVSVANAFRRVNLSTFDVVHAHGDDWMLGTRLRARTFYGTALMEALAATSWLRRGSQGCYYLLEWISSLNRSSVAISERTRIYLPLVRTSIPCAFDPDVFFPDHNRSSAPSILFVARTLVGRKRGHLLLRAFADVREVLPEVRLTVVSRDRVVAPGVTCLGPLGPSELADLYRSHWLLCSTSSYEGFGVPYVEALATGLPIVTTRNHGAIEVLRQGELGVICEPNELGGQLLALLRDEEKRMRLSTKGVLASEHYAISTIAGLYEHLYAQVMARRNWRRPPSPSPGCGV